MFKNNSKDEIPSAEAANANNTIGKGSVFTGNIQTYGNLRVEGRVNGDVISKSKVVIGPSAIIEGSLHAKVAEIEGEINGSVEVIDNLVLKPTCKILGNIITNKLIVESGAKFEGQCKMGGQNGKIDLKEIKKNSDIKKVS